MDSKFLLCKQCGALVKTLQDCTCTDCGIKCCGEFMQVLQPNNNDGAVEKHVPVVTIDAKNVSVVVGETSHPMQENHYIMWIMLKTNLGEYYRYLNPEDEPKAEFTMQKDEQAIAVFSYCNLHGLWQKNI